MQAATAVPLALSIFYTFFNVINTCILVWFIPLIIKVVEWMVPGKKEDAEDEFHLTYISHAMLSTDELSLQAAEKEVEMFSTLVLKMYKFLPDLRTAKTEEEFMRVFTRIEKNEALTDRMELEITKYLTNISAGDLSSTGSQRVSSLLRIIDNLESIGDAIYQMAMIRKNKRETAVHFDQGLNDNLSHMTELVQKALDVMDHNLHTDYDNIKLDDAYAAEDAINKYRDQLRNRHLDALKLGVYDYEIGTAYSALYALYEKLGDFVINVSEAIDNSKKVADNEEELQEMADAADDMPTLEAETEVENS
jgi:phosphate:Na+ symporter